MGRPRKAPGKGGPADLLGRRFGKLVALMYVQPQRGSDGARWLCVCDCGGRKIAKAENLKRGKSKSCGCDHRANRVAQVTKHGHARSPSGKPSPTYRVWHAMLQRCQNSNTAQFADYGGRGISVFSEWQDFRCFLRDMGERPKGTSIDRIDVNGNYEPSNCRWATQSEQAINKRPRMKHSHVLGLVSAARIVVAANDNNLPSAIESLRLAVANLDTRDA